MKTEADLRALLRRIDGASYGGYKQLRGSWDLGDMVVRVDRVQGDPFAAPSHISVLVCADVAQLPKDCWSTSVAAVATADFLARALAADLAQFGGRKRGSGKSGAVQVQRPGQEVLERTSCIVRADGAVEARLTVGLPAAGRRIRGKEAIGLLCEDVPDAADATLRAENLDVEALLAHVRCVEDQVHLRGQLKDAGLVAFLADGAILPRASGIDARPLRDNAVPLQTPDALAVTLSSRHSGPIRGLGIRRGITLIVGGGYHGKSTLLRAIQCGVYNHRPGDGRELVVTDPTAVKVRAEDGRRVEKVDISAFIGTLPGDRDTKAFCTASASGSTSQAATIVESLEAGATTLLIDEDTSATNFMIRDAAMRALIPDDREPITPLISRISGLFRDLDVCCVLVMGGSGDYFSAAQHVIAMQDYQPVDVTQKAHDIAAQWQRTIPQLDWPTPIGQRKIKARSLDASRGKRDASVGAREMRSLSFGTHEVDLSGVEQLVEVGQTRAIGEAILWLKRWFDRSDGTLAEGLNALDSALANEGLELLGRYRGDLTAVRRHEVAAALNRLRCLTVR